MKSLGDLLADDAEAIKKVARGKVVPYESAQRLLACGLLEQVAPGMVVLTTDGKAMYRNLARGRRRGRR